MKLTLRSSVDLDSMFELSFCKNLDFSKDSFFVRYERMRAAGIVPNARPVARSCTCFVNDTGWAEEGNR